MPAPSIYVSDLYLPPPGPETVPTAAQRDEAKKAAETAGRRFSELYADPSWNDKRRLRATMDAITCARALLDQQWKALGQSPANGIELCRRVMERHPDVPFVFYSRKITPEDVIRVLHAGAVDAIRKGVDPATVRDRLENTQRVFSCEDVRGIRAQGLNVNVTIIPSR
jgi:DNA-binding NarL/FixJ family response regulator